jgi:hypothetical protein
MDFALGNYYDGRHRLLPGEAACCQAIPGSPGGGPRAALQCAALVSLGWPYCPKGATLPATARVLASVSELNGPGGGALLGGAGHTWTIPTAVALKALHLLRDGLPPHRGCHWFPSAQGWGHCATAPALGTSGRHLYPRSTCQRPRGTRRAPPLYWCWLVDTSVGLLVHRLLTLSCTSIRGLLLDCLWLRQ